MTRTLFITGASSGIGHAVVQNLQTLDYRIIAVARRPMPQWHNHPRITPVTLDLSDLTALPKALETILNHYPDLDGLVSCVGRGRFGQLEQFAYDQIRAEVDVNLLTHMYLARWLVPHLKTRNRGDLIFIGSDAGLQGAKKGSLYCASKFALRGFAQSLRAECATRDVRVSLIQPGMVKSPFYDDLDFEPGAEPDQHLLPEDIAETVAFILNLRPGVVVDDIHLSPMRKVIRSKKNR